ncbi:SDR family NAD(P)-dependent oxidoreductase [Autumnicola musiva]|uniref:SDR family oxidoreductase n=1 Tax=Autumnicola musiva TaxID=3075589 RepID=A0ABU3D7F5_9FLAO|nr:SDR family oxidoreductase [Zunongwangia sp. F117]MDT0677453.1 SDR family oxidoreductase [Zunongwangia sp. F117]
MIYNFNLKSKTVLITGGYGYLGKAVTESLLYHEATVFVLGRSNKKFEETFNESPYINKTLFFENCDVSDSKSIRTAFNNINDKSSIDILINNAFYSKGQSPEEMSDEDWNTGIDGTLNSVFRCIREVIPYLKGKSSGKIINVSSMYGMVAPEFNVYKDFPQFLNPPHYGAAKAGVIQLTRYYASHLGSANITVNAVTPGPFPSGPVQEEKGFVEELEKKTCLNRIGKPEDLGGAFVFLASDTSNFMTGQNLVIDGGWTIK